MLTLLIATLAGCGGEAPLGAPATRIVVTPAATPSAWPMTVVDGLNRKVTVMRPPARVVSIAPSNTEILFAVGAGDRLVGRTRYCTYPPEAAPIAAIGGMSPKTINLESLVALRPDLVLATGGIQEAIIAPLEALNLPVVALDADDFDGVARNIRLAGALLDRAADADRVATGFLDRVAAVRRRVGARPGPRPRVLYLVSTDPLMTAGPKTFIGRMIELAGGTNIFADVATAYPRPSEEEILARAPEVILSTRGAMNDGPADDRARRARLASRPGWDQLPAIRHGRITFLPEDEVSRPSPRLADGLEAIAHALEPTPPAPTQLIDAGSGSE